MALSDGAGQRTAVLCPTGVVTTVGAIAEARALWNAAARRDEFATHNLRVVDVRPPQPRLLDDVLRVVH